MGNAQTRHVAQVKDLQAQAQQTRRDLDEMTLKAEERKKELVNMNQKYSQLQKSFQELLGHSRAQAAELEHREKSAEALKSQAAAEHPAKHRHVPMDNPAERESENTDLTETDKDEPTSPAGEPRASSKAQGAAPEREQREQRGQGDNEAQNDKGDKAADQNKEKNNAEEEADNEKNNAKKEQKDDEKEAKMDEKKTKKKKKNQTKSRTPARLPRKNPAKDDLSQIVRRPAVSQSRWPAPCRGSSNHPRVKA